MGDPLLLRTAFQNGLEPLEVCAPPDFEELLGCLCVTEYLAFYPSECGSGVVYDNGVLEDYVDPVAWENWTSEPQVREKILSASTIAYPALVLDTCTRTFYMVGEEQARDFLYQHYVAVTGLPLL